VPFRALGNSPVGLVLVAALNIGQVSGSAVPCPSCALVNQRHMRRNIRLLCCVPRIPAGASQLEAEDWDTGAAVTIPLDTNITPMEVAEGLYKRARKLRRAVDAVQPLLEAAQQELGYLESVSRRDQLTVALVSVSAYTCSICLKPCHSVRCHYPI
jgi:hypothetical protein